MSYQDKPLRERNWSQLIQNFTVVMNDDTVLEVTNTVGDVLAWEAKHKRSFVEGGQSVTDVMWVMWKALRRTEQIESTDPEGWARDVRDFAADQVEWEDPTNPGASPGSQSSSASPNPAPLPATGSESSSETPD